MTNTRITWYIVRAVGILAFGVCKAFAEDVDFGDAPSPYPVRANEDGARHLIVPGWHLGETVDAEPDGQPSAFASSDDSSWPGLQDDEDGVFCLQADGQYRPLDLSELRANNDHTLKVTASSFLDAARKYYQW